MTMKKNVNRLIRKTCTRLLTLLGIGSASMLFVACYGAPPTRYEVIEDGDTIALVSEDSIAMVMEHIDMAEQSVADTDSLDVVAVQE